MPKLQFLLTTSRTTAVLAFAISACPLAAHAGQCDGDGQLRFLGVSADSSRSVWLSSTSAGTYRLDAAQGNQTVDNWSKDKRKLHLSLSPVVSTGNGGVHKLYSSNNCLLDAQNQKRGIAFPPGITRPPSFKPLIPLTPSLPSMPEIPGGVTPPLGSLTPDTLTPSVPTMPNLPGRVTPPIATLPPETITPELPSKPNLPPQTLTPGLPTKPNLPGGVTPPIATLPPETLTPGVPTQPVSPSTDKPAASLQTSGIQGKATPTQPCAGRQTNDPTQSTQLADCYAAEPQPNELPLTAGRELVAKSEWNIWVNGSASRLRDTRDGMDTRGHTQSLSMGIDRVLNDDTVAGLQVSVSKSASNSFENTLQTDSTTYSVGPYVSYSFSPNWLVYGALGFERQSADTQIVSLKGTSNANQYSLNLQLEGQYVVGASFVRPKIQLSHTHNRGDTYELKGSVLNTPLTLEMNNQSFNYGLVQGLLEFNHPFDLGKNRLIMPFVEAGLYYEYARPGSGRHLTSNLTYADSQPWGGVLRAGVRSLISQSTMPSFELGNQSIGINDLNIWEVRLLISHSF